MKKRAAKRGPGVEKDFRWFPDRNPAKDEEAHRQYLGEGSRFQMLRKKPAEQGAERGDGDADNKGEPPGLEQFAQLA